jgi:hypothetical protein
VYCVRLGFKAAVRSGGASRAWNPGAPGDAAQQVFWEPGAACTGVLWCGSECAVALWHRWCSKSKITLEEANRIAAEIERGDTSNIHMLEERGVALDDSQVSQLGWASISSVAWRCWVAWRWAASVG